jgi:hypothetical protein
MKGTTMKANLDQAAGLRRRLIRVERHLHWARAQGVSRLVEEDDLHLVERCQRAYGKWRWRQQYGVPPGEAVAVFLVGVQRSGTNMVVRGLEASSEFEVHNENDRRAFNHFRLRSLPEIRSIVERSRHPFVLFKPLCDSHRTDELLDELGTTRSARAIWAYRSVDGRVASALAKFGDVNRQVLREIASGCGDQRWQAQRLSPASLELIGRFDYDIMTPATAGALFWYVRNVLVFERGFDRRPDLTVVSYEALVADPENRMRELCAFLGVRYDPGLVVHVERRPPRNGRRLDIDPVVRELCNDLEARLAHLSRLSSSARPDRSRLRLGVAR